MLHSIVQLRGTEPVQIALALIPEHAAHISADLPKAAQRVTILRRRRQILRQPILHAGSAKGAGNQPLGNAALFAEVLSDEQSRANACIRKGQAVALHKGQTTAGQKFLRQCGIMICPRQMQL